MTKDFLATVRKRLNMRWIAFVLRHSTTLRTSYVSTIAERNALKEAFEQLGRQFDIVSKIAMDSDRAIVAFCTMLNQMNTERPGSLQVVVADEPLAAVFQFKLNNLARRARGEDPLDDPFPELPAPAGVSRRMH